MQNMERTLVITLKEKDLEFTKEYLIDGWLKRIDQDMDVIIACSGREGTGKSSGSIILAHILCERQNKTFSIKNNIHYNIEDFHAAVFNSEPGDVQIIDEAILFAFSRQAMKKENTTLVKILATCRSKNNIIFFNIPNLKTIDSYIKQHRLVCNLDFYTRGKFRIWGKRAIRQMMLGKPHNQRRRRTDSIQSAEIVLGKDIWNEYLKHKENKVAGATMELKPKADEQYASPKSFKKYGLSSITLSRYAEKGHIKFLLLPSGVRRYLISDVEKVVGLEGGSN